MADFGLSPYAWGKNSLVEPGVGSNIADSVSGFGDVYGVPKQLEARLSEWATQFEQSWDSPEFEWPAFHCVGKGLVAELRQVLGEGFIVNYKKPIEAPDYEIDDCNHQRYHFA